MCTFGNWTKVPINFFASCITKLPPLKSADSMLEDFCRFLILIWCCSLLSSAGAHGRTARYGQWRAPWWPRNEPGQHASVVAGRCDESTKHGEPSSLIELCTSSSQAISTIYFPFYAVSNFFSNEIFCSYAYYMFELNQWHNYFTISTNMFF